jgi:Uma2 family endonuclease
VTEVETIALSEELNEIPIPDVSRLVTEDETPVDNLFSAKQQRLLVETLYSSWSTGRRFLADTNVALYASPNQPPVVPDMFLSLDVAVAEDWFAKRHRSYFIWEFGKAPEVVVEIVSNRVGDEDEGKLEIYARIGIRYYVIYDPTQQLSNHVLRLLELRGLEYGEMAEFWLPGVELGLTFWQGIYEQKEERWLRWCDREGELIPTGAEQRQRAEQEYQRAEQERQRAEQERQRAEQERQRAETLAAQLRALGIEPAAD